MNLPLNSGWLGVLEAALIAFLVGMLVYWFFHVRARRQQWKEGQAFGWACLLSVVLAAGIDLWHMIPLYTVNPNYGARIQQIVAGIHDPVYLGSRVVMETLGALVGVLCGWLIGMRGKH